MEYDFEHFKNAQSYSYNTALEEVKGGKKRSHWMWFIFPQLRWLAKSDIAYKYGISGITEAEAYLQDPLLGQRLIDISNALMEVKKKDAAIIFGWPDYRKLKSCMTLFSKVEGADPVFSEVIAAYFIEEDNRTLQILELQKFNYEDIIFSEIIRIQNNFEIPEKMKVQYRYDHFEELTPLVQAMMARYYHVNDMALSVIPNDASIVYSCIKNSTYINSPLTKAQKTLVEQYRNDICQISEEYQKEKEKADILEDLIQSRLKEKWEKYWEHFQTLPTKIQSIVFFEYCRFNMK